MQITCICKYKFCISNDEYENVVQHPFPSHFNLLTWMKHDQHLSFLWLRPCPSSVVFIHGCHPWIASIDDTSIHGWHFSIHGWHPWMAFLHPWMTLLHPWMTFLHPWMTSLHPWMTSTDDISPSMDGISPSMDDISPSMDDIHGWHFSIHGWYARTALSSMDEVSPSMDGISICQVYFWKLPPTLAAFLRNW